MKHERFTRDHAVERDPVPVEPAPVMRRIRTRCGMRAWVPDGVDLNADYGPLPHDPTTTTTERTLP